MTPIRLLLVDDQEIVRAGLCSLLEGHPELEIIGEAATGEEAVALTAQLQPDVVLMDIAMPGLGGLEATLAIRRLPGMATVPILAMTARITSSVTSTPPTSRWEKPITRNVASSRARSASEMRALL